MHTQAKTTIKREETVIKRVRSEIWKLAERQKQKTIWFKAKRTRSFVVRIIKICQSIANRIDRQKRRKNTENVKRTVVQVDERLSSANWLVLSWNSWCWFESLKWNDSTLETLRFAASALCPSSRRRRKRRRRLSAERDGRWDDSRKNWKGDDCICTCNFSKRGVRRKMKSKNWQLVRLVLWPKWAREQSSRTINRMSSNHENRVVAFDKVGRTRSVCIVQFGSSSSFISMLFFFMPHTKKWSFCREQPPPTLAERSKRRNNRQTRVRPISVCFDTSLAGNRRIVVDLGHCPFINKANAVQTKRARIGLDVNQVRHLARVGLLVKLIEKVIDPFTCGHWKSNQIEFKMMMMTLHRRRKGIKKTRRGVWTNKVCSLQVFALNSEQPLPEQQNTNEWFGIARTRY